MGSLSIAHLLNLRSPYGLKGSLIPLFALRICRGHYFGAGSGKNVELSALFIAMLEIWLCIILVTTKRTLYI